MSFDNKGVGRTDNVGGSDAVQANTINESKKEKRNGFFYRMLCGAFIGISIIAPGVSGSIMAVMMGIYDDLIGIISNPFRNFKRNFIYVLPMVIGAGAGMVLLLQALDVLFTNYPTPAYLLFISLIAGSIPTVISEARAGGGGFKAFYAAGTVCALAFALTVGMMAKHDIAIAVDTTSMTSGEAMVYFPVCGAIAGVMSMVPGMSVSMVLMTLRVYEPLLNAASSFDFATIVPVGLAFLVGMVLFSNLTKIVFTKYRSFACYMVAGFMTGSLISIFPPLPSGAMEWIMSAFAITVGILVSVLFRYLGRRMKVSGAAAKM